MECIMKFLSTAALVLLVASPALAQTATPSPAPSAPPTATAPPSGPSYYTFTPGQMRASKLIGTNVRNAASETIGEINELILDKDGKVAAVVIGVGGFLGIGAREVALDYKSLNVKYDPNAMTDAGATTVTVNATKESLSTAPAWTWNRETSTGGSTTQPRTPATPGGATR
jgi:hypothetical protein